MHGPVARRILATHLLDNLDAAIETLPPECQPLDPATCEHPTDAHKQFRDSRVVCLDCGSQLQPH